VTQIPIFIGYWSGACELSILWCHL